MRHVFSLKFCFALALVLSLCLLDLAVSTQAHVITAAYQPASQESLGDLAVSWVPPVGVLWVHCASHSVAGEHG
jgi:hypothetical protein